MTSIDAVWCWFPDSVEGNFGEVAPSRSVIIIGSVCKANDQPGASSDRLRGKRLDR